VVQRHRATRLHYDFRLEIGGVLVSWAVPKGPSLDPGQRRMAVHVEDHPIEYFDFEGIIPARQYGAGDVIVWDWGTWEPEAETPDPAAAIAKGELKFSIRGEKLKGRFTIVRTTRRGASARPFEDDAGEQWLLIHKRDSFASPGWDAEDHPRSVKTGRTNDEVKENRDAVWLSRAPAAEAEIDLAGAVEAGPPSFISPMLATLASKPFRDEEWLFEIKWDGYRVQSVVHDGKVRLYTRTGKDAETYFGSLLSPPNWIAAADAVVDGEVVALDEAGAPDFSLLQERISGLRSGGVRGRGGWRNDGGERTAEAPLVYQVFDLLHLDGRSLLGVPLEDRKRLLRSVLREGGRVRFASHVETEGLAFYEAAKTRRLEGMIAKHRRSRYEPGRRVTTWLKIKLRPEQELVVGGWTPGEGNAKDLGAVIVGYYEDGRLRFGGKVGSGFTGHTRAQIRKRLEALATDRAPFDPAPEKRGELRLANWTKPELVIRAELGGWTRDGIVRQTSFKGIDEGRDPRTVTREIPVEVGVAEQDAEETVDAADAAAASVKTGRRKTRDQDAARRGSDGLPKAALPEELEALDAIKTEGLWRVGDDELKLTNLEKPLFPPAAGSDDKPITKRELIRYFALIAPAMLPHLAERALNLHRYPNGASAPGFWQKDIPPHAPKWLRLWHETGFEDREDREANDHLVADRVTSLCWLGNQAAFEIHAWTSTIEDPWRPTFALIDIDPGEKTTWDETLTLARLFRAALGHLEVRGYPKLTGRRGIQVWIPIVRGRYSYNDTSDWVEKLSRAVAGTVPDLVSWEWAKARRKGLARLDYTQNQPIKTLVAPYAVRPAPGAPVSAPISWDELDDGDLRPDRWTVRNLPERVERVGDLFADAQTDAQELPNL
jgi:bifunctional non-homologous end joining protein LigD